MFIFGHLGIGKKIASPWSGRLPKLPLFLGMLLPDLIDKTLWYGGRALSGPLGFSMGPITCTRTFGHTGVLLVSILLLARIRNSRWLAALALGMTTHLLLDCLIDRFDPSVPSSALIALAWPFLQAQFAHYTIPTMWEHLHRLVSAPILVSEALGLSLLGWDYWKS